MKRWIVKQSVQISEITSRPVPGWIRRLVTEEEFNSLKGDEKDLTRALTAQRSDQPVMPDELRARIETATRRSAPARLPIERSFPSVSWALAAAALLVLGTVLVFRPPASWSPSKESAPLLAEQTPASETDKSDEGPRESPALPAEALSSDILLKPLASEQERLAADVTNALKFVADSFLPSVYAASVNDSLQSVEQRFLKSI